MRLWHKIIITITAIAALSPSVEAESLTGPLSIASEPIYLGGAADSNVVFTLDNSGSMGWDYAPDLIASSPTNSEKICKQNRFCVQGDPPYYSSSVDTIYYDPSVTYVPAVDSSNVSMGNIGSPWTSVADSPFTGNGTTNLISGYPDVAYCGGTTTVYNGGTLNACGNTPVAPCIGKTGNIVKIILTSSHGLVDGDIIDVTSGSGTCDADARVSKAVVTVIDAYTFTYDEGGNGGIGNSRDCQVTKLDCKRNGVDTANPFEYRTASPDDPYTNGLPSSPYTTATNINTNSFFFVPVVQEFCTDKTLTSCIASTTATASNPEPAYLRYCDTWAHADDVPGTNTGCQANFDSTHKAARYSKFYRQDIVSSVATYGNVQVGGVTVIDRSNRTDCTTNGAPNCTYSEEMTNFANWFTYYRTRMNTMKTGVGRAFAQLNGHIRIGFAKISQGSLNVDNYTSPGAMVLGVRDFTGTDKSTWFTTFYGTTTSGSTPLRRAVDYVGQYYQRYEKQGPWATDPATGQVTVNGTLQNEDPAKQSACRQSYDILSTDGYWNGSTPSTISGTNVDDAHGAPYQDAWSDTLADVAMYYWENDLRSSATIALANVVPTNSKDIADWQHMVTYTIGFGVNGQLDPVADKAGIWAGTTAWPQPVQNTPTTIDDLWHASINGRGDYFSVKSGGDIVNALISTLADIRDRESSAAAVSLSSTSLQTGTTVYRGEMNTGDWSGDLFAYVISDGNGTGTCAGVPAGKLCPDPTWNASNVLTNALNGNANYWNTGRHIVTYNDASKSAMAFRWGNLTSSQQTVMRTNPDTGANESIAIGQRRLDYLRGKDDSLFRPRLNYLGDIIYSSPVYVGSTMSGGKPVALYPDDWPGTAPEDSVPYSTWASNATRSGRDAMVYVGANDGMLHAFNASNGGTEEYAFIPSAVYGTVDTANGKYGRLNQLSSTGYPDKHIYFVDGTQKVEDVFFDRSDSTWHTVLVGSLRAGGRGIYALDITNPLAANEAAATGKVLWEFTEADDADLGLTYGEPYIARMKDNKWAVVIGNGYNSSTADGATGTGHAVLFILYLDADLSDGTWDLGVDYRKYDTKVGTAAIPNGLASPGVADVDGDMVADFVYVGDLQGKMWKVDVSSTNASNWGFALGTAAAPVPLFTALGTDGYAQQITTRPEVGRHPTVPGSYLIYFGTGKDIEATDNYNTGKQTQSFYGIWDKNGQAGGFSAFTRSHLLEQTILSESVTNGVNYRQTSANSIAWHDTAGTPAVNSGTYLGWYMDLVNTEAGNTDNKGERQSTNSLLRSGNIIFTTQIPSTDPCTFGGTGWLMVLDAPSGSLLLGSPFSDAGGPSTAGGRGFNNLPSGPVYAEGETNDYVYVSDSSGDTEVVVLEKPTAQNGRRSWQQLQ